MSDGRLKANHKRCPRCGEMKPRTEEYWYVVKSKSRELPQLSSHCRECSRAAAREWEAAHPEQAKKHRRDASRRFRKRNPERAREHGRASQRCYRKRYPEKVRARAENMREYQRAYSVRFRLEHHDLANARSRESQRRHPERLKATNHAGRMKRKAVPGHFTAADLRRLHGEQGGCCYYCEIRLDGKYHVDHTIPIARGGTNDPANLALACARCNLRKGKRTAEEFLARITSFDCGFNAVL